MRQQDYELILTCIQQGVPAIAPQLITVLNNHLELANKYLDEHKVDEVDVSKEVKGE